MQERTEITIETEEILSVRQIGKVRQLFCENCGYFVPMASARTASILYGVSERQIFQFVEAGEIHFFENDRVIVCIDSLRRCV